MGTRVFAGDLASFRAGSREMSVPGISSQCGVVSGTSGIFCKAAGTAGRGELIKLPTACPADAGRVDTAACVPEKFEKSCLFVGLVGLTVNWLTLTGGET